MLQNPIQLSVAVIATRPDERGNKRVRCIWDLEKALPSHKLVH